MTGCPSIRMPNVAVTQPNVLTSAELELIIGRLPITDANLKQGIGLAIHWGYATGLRELEVAGLCRDRLADAIDRARSPSSKPHGGSLRSRLLATRIDSLVLDLASEWTKGGYGGKVVVPRNLVKSSVEWLELQPDVPVCAGIRPVFASSRGRPYKPETLGRYFRAAAVAAGIPASFHDLRHSWATGVLEILMEAGEEHRGKLFVQTQLRHRSPESTDRYIHLAKTRAGQETAGLAVNKYFSRSIKQ